MAFRGKTPVLTHRLRPESNRQQFVDGPFSFIPPKISNRSAVVTDAPYARGSGNAGPGAHDPPTRSYWWTSRSHCLAPSTQVVPPAYKSFVPLTSAMAPPATPTGIG